MSHLQIKIHNQNTEEESFKMASYLFMTCNLQTALEVVNRELHTTKKLTDEQGTA